MDRDAFIRLLARAVQDGTITEDEAMDLLRRFDAGTLSVEALPLSAGELDSNASEELIAAALLALALLVRRRAADTVDIVQERFERRARALTLQLAEGEIDIQEWQRAMNEEIIRNLAEQTLAGSGTGRLSPTQRQRIRELAREQNAYLSRFADTVVVAGLAGAALSAAVMANRAESYAGIGRGEFFRARETEHVGERGIVAYYRSRDDNSTCIRCLDAERNGPYLPGTNHPYPGSVCLGRSHCRCWIEYVYDLVAYERLSRQ